MAVKIEKMVNNLIKSSEEEGLINTNNISDGSHTFGELYYHRMILFAYICNQNPKLAWKSLRHSDGSIPFENKNYFIVGIETPYGQVTYHYERKYWNKFHVKILKRAKEYDGHTPWQAIKRIEKMGKKEIRWI